MNLPRIACVVGAMLSLAMLDTPALADSNRHGADEHDTKLRGKEEVPAVITGASGRFEMTIAPDDSSFDFTLTYEDLEGGLTLPVTPTQAHIHIGQKTANGGIVVFLCTNLTPPMGVPIPPPCPASPGTVTGTRGAADVLPQPTQGISAGELAAVLKAIRKGLAYANVHTPVSTGGEIRGQISGDHDHGHDRN
jgi:hypothetical protein